VLVLDKSSTTICNLEINKYMQVLLSKILAFTMVPQNTQQF